MPVRKRQTPAVAFDYGAANTQTKPETIGLGGEEGLEQPRRKLRADAGAVVGHTHLDEPVHQRGVDLQTPLRHRRVAHGLQAVEQQVQQHLFQQGPVTPHQWQAGLQVGVDPGRLCTDLQLEQCERICDQVVDHEFTGIFRLRLERAADLAQDRAGPLRLRLPSLQCGPAFFPVLVEIVGMPVWVRRKAVKQFVGAVPRHGAKRRIDVQDAPGHVAHTQLQFEPGVALFDQPLPL
jgi:hypothetical protein